MPSNGMPDLSRMPDAEYKQMSSRDLAMYNTELPQLNYSKPYSHQDYPAVRYRVILVDGERMLEDIECPDAKTDAQLRAEGWKESPSACGVETHPAAAPLARRRSPIPIPKPEATAEVEVPAAADTGKKGKGA